VQNNTNIDGIRKSKKTGMQAQPNFRGPRFMRVDSIVRMPAKKVAAKTVSSPFFVVPDKAKAKQAVPFLFFRKIYSPKKVPVAAAVLGLVIAFGFGMWSVLDTKNSTANDRTQVLGAFTDQPNSGQTGPSGPPIAGAQLQGQNGGSISNDVLFNTPIEYLQNYFQSTSQPDVINTRKNQLKKFLTDRHSPLAGASETIAEQEHWELILAIAFAESTLGKNCADNNCSNIGVKPGAPSWRSYVSYSAWVVDFNRLLDKKYKDWTLEQMCGVYVKPCNPNWLLATKQILSDLKEQSIE
jgi:hypothetical protein